jgi:hypothetical protein
VKRLAVAASVAALLAGAPVLAPLSASASSGCVERADYRAVKVGWTKDRVHRKLGTTGMQTIISTSGGRTVEVRTYVACSDPTGGDNITIAYERKPGTAFLRLSYKNAVWV